MNTAKINVVVNTTDGKAHNFKLSYLISIALKHHKIFKFDNAVVEARVNSESPLCLRMHNTQS